MEEKLPWIYANVGVDYDERVLPSITTEVLKAVVVSDVSDANIFWVRARFLMFVFSVSSWYVMFMHVCVYVYVHAHMFSFSFTSHRLSLMPVN